MNKTENNAQALLKALKNRKKRGNRSSQSDVAYFSMEDVRQVLREREDEQRAQESRIKVQNKQKLIEKVLVEKKNTVVSAVGIADILGFNPKSKPEKPQVDKRKIDPKYRKYYLKLLQLKDIVESKTSVPVELEFAWSMLKNEPDKMKEIQDALDRIEHKTYGVCEITGEPIAEERLDMVPFTRYSLNGQQQHERQIALKKEKQSGSLFNEDSENMFEESYEESE